MGEDMVTIGMVVGLDYRDTELSVHDLLQELKTHKRIHKILRGGERLEWGAKTIPEGGFLSLPRRLNAPGLLLVGDGAGFVNVPALKGIHYAVESGRLAAEAAWAALQRGETPSRLGALDNYDESIRKSFVWKDLWKVRNMRPAFKHGFWLGGGLAGAMTASFGHFPRRDYILERDAEQDLITHRSREVLPARGREADLRQALLGLRLREQDARRPARPHRDRAPRPARHGRDVGADVPGAGLRAGRARRRQGARADDPVELRPVRRDHRQGRPADPARGRLRARVLAVLGSLRAFYVRQTAV